MQGHRSTMFERVPVKEMGISSHAPSGSFRTPRRLLRLRAPRRGLLVSIILFILIFNVCIIYYALCLRRTAPATLPSEWLSMMASAVPSVGPLVTASNSTQRTESSAELQGLNLQLSVHTPEKLEELYGDMDFVYTFVNGTDLNHFFRRTAISGCWNRVQEELELRYEQWRTLNRTEVGGRIIASCLPKYVTKSGMTRAELLAGLRRHAKSSGRDHEVGELRYSMRSVEKHIPWHRGRLRLVSPGHVPSWVDGARNFMSGACGGGGGRRAGEHVRLTTVHQDALLPYGARLTTNSHVIEKFLWRVRGLTPVHVYLNDDYFVNRPAKVTDFVNEYGGTIIRTEAGMIRSKAVDTKRSGSWSEGVSYTNHFIIAEVDEKRAVDIPPSFFAHLRIMGMDWNTTLRKLTAAQKEKMVNQTQHPSDTFKMDFDMDHYLYWAYEFPPAPLVVDRARKANTERYYVTHAPFTYCTNMFRFFAVRYAEVFADVVRRRPSRSMRDLYMPFLYNGFVLARPWQASPRFLNYAYHLQTTPDKSKVNLTIHMDNKDGCATPTLLRGAESGCMFAKLSNNVTTNAIVQQNILSRNPLFFNINGQFDDSVGADLRSFLHKKFPDPIFLDVARPDEDAAAAELRATHAALMRLPVVLVVAHRENACGLLRSLQLGLREHAGPVQVVVVGNAALGSAPWCSALPTVQCDYNSTVVTQRAVGSEAELQGVLAEVGRGATAVRVPAACEARGGGGGAGAEVRLLVIDARATEGAGADKDGLHALAALGQTLALEDFATVRVGGADGSAAALRVDRDSDIHWVYGGCESDLLQTYPLPLERYESMEGHVLFL